MKTFNTKSKMLTIAYVAVGLFFGSTVFGQSSPKDKINSEQEKTYTVVEEFKEGKYLVSIIALDNKTFGYNIYKGNELIVHQINKVFQNIPDGFKNKGNALKFARFHLSIIDTKRDQNELIKIENIRKLSLTSEDLPNLNN